MITVDTRQLFLRTVRKQGNLPKHAPENLKNDFEIVYLSIL